MNEEIELLVRKFEDEIARNSDYRIEEFPVDPTLFEKWTNKERDFFFREIILAETDARFADKQPLIKKEYEQRFPNLLKHVDDAFDRLDKLRQEKDSFDLMNVTMDYQGGLVVHLQGRSDLPEELGRFREITPIAEGGFGIVCRAYDSEAQKFRALKFPTRTYSRDDEFLAEVRKEADCAGNLDHPNIVKTIGMEVIDPFPFVVQEFVEGTNLRDWMKTERSFPAKAKMMAKIAAGLHFAHINDITHLDIKPENILVDDDGQPKITDFGMAFHEKNRLGLPRRNIMGTMKYLSPEVANGYLRQADNRADIFSLGVIFYEMLTGRKPFGHGNNDEEEIILEITTKEPQPISFDKANVPDELRRICVKCLQKKILDRYQLASEVERELNEWIVLSAETESTTPESPEKGDSQKVVRRKFVPRGIASYTEEDGDFFLDLLPGVRDQGDVPASITFWTRRICVANTDTPTVPNAFIFGPSGSGKSSFVKAGLFPQIQKQTEAGQSQPVQTIYVESTRDDTEVRLLNALRKKYPDIPSDESLPDVFAGLANGRWQTSATRPTKILLVIDQFEQWISRGEEFETTQLVHALKHCNGEQLQCLMLVRDDFVYACNRFADSLDINLEEGKNYQNVDPFDKKHARKILIKHLHAYDETFPDNEEGLQREQKDFLKEAIQQLAEDNRIVCVRLILFAEMFKDREWTVKELKSVGGVAGVGEQFLESHFGDEGNRLHRIYRKQVQAIFEELLPEAGTKIRGVMKSREDLMAAAKCENDEATFDKIIHLLETELKLVTATEPDGLIAASDVNKPSNLCYQLTHDYLVASIRKWIFDNLNETPSGRIRIRFSELSDRWAVTRENRFLPTLLEFTQLIRHHSTTNLKPNEKLLWKRTLHFYSIGLATTILILVCGIILAVAFSRFQHDTLAEQYVERFVGGHPEAVSSNVLLMRRYEKSAKRILGKRLDSTSDVSQRIRLSVGLAMLGYRHDDALEVLIKAIGQDFDSHSKNIILALESIPSSRQRLKAEFDLGKKLDSAIRSRIALSLCYLGESNWLAERLETESLDFQTHFVHTGKFWVGSNERLDMILNPKLPSNVSAIYCQLLASMIENGAFVNTSGSFKRIEDSVSRMFHESQDSFLIASADLLLRRIGAKSGGARRNDHKIVPTSLDTLETASSVWVEMIGMRMHRVEKRRISVETKIGRDNHTLEVDIPSSFFAADREVTVGDFKLFLTDKSYGENRKPVGLELPDNPTIPIGIVSYIDAIMYCNWLSTKMGLQPCYTMLNYDYEINEFVKSDKQMMAALKVPLNRWRWNQNANGFRLPTFAEWQCIEKQNDDCDFYFGNQSLRGYCHHYGWFRTNSVILDGEKALSEVRQKLPNKFGMFDLYGNVSELCFDFPFSDKLPSAGTVVSHRGFSSDFDSAQLKKIGYKIIPPYARRKHTGFRVVANFCADN